MYFTHRNHLQAFDRAVTDRVDEIVNFENPGLEERVELLELYWDQLVVRTPFLHLRHVNVCFQVKGGGSTANKIRIDESLDGFDWRDVAKQIDGFSGRSIMKLCGAFQVGSSERCQC